MKILERRVFGGPNLWAHFPVIELTVDLEILEKWPTAKLDGFVDRLLAAVPSLAEHGCSYNEPGGFIRRLREGEGTWLGHVLEHVAIELQNLSGANVTFGKTRSIDPEKQPGIYHVVYTHEEARCGKQAGDLAIRLIHHLLPDEVKKELPSGLLDDDFEFQSELEEFIRLVQRRAFGPSTASLVKAAEARNIPWIRLNDYSLVQFGHGRFQKRIQATVTGETRHIAVMIASDKEETNQICRDLGLPVPGQRLVRREQDAVRAAERLGYPVVVKPLDANHGRGVSINLSDADAVRTAFAAAREHARSVLVESFISGFDHRMLVVNGELVAVSRRVPGHVVGDGEHTVEELVDIVNQDPNRGIGHEKVLTRLELDHQARRLMAAEGVATDTVLEKGRTLYLRSTANLSTGGTAVDVTDVTHPDNREMAIRAIKAIGLDVGGVDFLTSDITRSYREVGGAICEINAAPGFRMHVAPTEGTPRDVAGPVMDMLFAPGSPTRIPVAAITGTNGKTTTARMLAHIQKLTGMTVGLATTDGVYIDGNRAVEGDMTGPVAAQMVLRDPTVDSAVLETARGGLLRAGLGYRSCNVAACLNIAEDHLGLRGVDTVEQLATVKRIVIEVAEDAVFLNADDPNCLRMADHSRAERIWYVTMDPSHTLVREHIRSGGGAVVLEGGINGHMVTIYDGISHIPLLWTHLIPATLEGKAMHNVQNAMFAAGMAYASGIRLDDIRHGLRTFDTSFFQAPGRMNVFDEHPFKVIVDYGHNPAAIEAMVNVTDNLEVEGKRIVVISLPGDRRDVDIEEAARVAAGHFDHYICRRDDNPRGRDEREIPLLLRKALIANGVDEDKIEPIVDEPAAVTRALELAEPGDLVLLFADQVTRTWKQVTKFRDPAGDDDDASQATESVVVPPLPHPLPPEISSAKSLIRDARGVRLAREAED